MKKGFMIFFLILLTLPIISLEKAENDISIIDDQNVRITLSPSLSYGGWVYINFTSKVYSGEIDFAFGYNSDNSFPKQAQLYKPRIIVETYSYVIPDRYFSDPNYSKKCLADNRF